MHNLGCFIGSAAQPGYIGGSACLQSIAMEGYWTVCYGKKFHPLRRGDKNVCWRRIH
ncbi:hypothetical protein CRG98_031403 [Punica granatum]|uniref:Uncharacterized protein n=1 Tax=Punica granatum TaxID=22663 RepID=A0A2I0IXQ6_PUNGR|nr:hypothetical protein CRG98_031403 [Punica granatum]